MPSQSESGRRASGRREFSRNGLVVAGRAGRQGGQVVEMQRRRLLSAFSELVAEEGLESAGAGRICKRAGVSRRTFYDMFEDREACFLAAFELSVERIERKILPAGKGELCWRRRVRIALTVLLECFDNEPKSAWLCVVETLKGGPEILEARRKVLDELAAALDRGRGEAKGVEPPALTAQSTVGGALAVIHARLVERDARPLLGLLNPLMSMIVHPYLGSAASRKELDRPTPIPLLARVSDGPAPVSAHDPFKDLPIRITFRTARVLTMIGSQPDASNREIGQIAGVTDQGQMSKLLTRLERAGLVENHGQGQAKGEANAWQLTARGQGVLQAIGNGTGT